MLEKESCITDYERSLEVEKEKEGELSNFVEDQKAVIDQLENRINDYRAKVRPPGVLCLWIIVYFVYDLPCILNFNVLIEHRTKGT